ncbi:MAG: hydrogenase maturation protease [Candidatus Kryptoniota bacterium]
MKRLGEQGGNFRNLRIAIIGVGNEFRGDDAAGLLCVRNLKKCVHQNEAEIIELSADISTLLEIIPKWDAVIIIDAVQSIAAPGTILRIDPAKAIKTGVYFSSSTHSIDLFELIKLSKITNKPEVRVVVYGIVGKNFSYSTIVSPVVKVATERICDRIKWELRKLGYG